MIEREHGTQFLVCDSCGDSFTEPYERDEVQRMIDDAKEAGWLVKSGRGEWTHTCPKCVPSRDEFEEVEI